jgi:hypothetical protein
MMLPHTLCCMVLLLLLLLLLHILCCMALLLLHILLLLLLHMLCCMVLLLQQRTLACSSAQKSSGPLPAGTAPPGGPCPGLKGHTPQWACPTCGQTQSNIMLL